jgi:pyridoxine 5-phosphate synthase
VAVLSVNINKIATIRNARGGNNPDITQVAKDCESFGAQGITVHPRPDERHIRYKDVYDLKKVVTTEFNVEGYPSTQFMDLVLDVVPDQVTLVPDPPDALTSNTGWDTTKYLELLSETIVKLQGAGIRTSIFLNPDPSLLKSAKETGTDRIELYTGDYAHGFDQDKIGAISKFKETAYEATKYNIGVNAGHDLDLSN